MSLAQCLTTVQQGDPERFALLAGGDETAKARLLPLYALNLEFARAAWASKEPMVAEMRLQWWIDAFEDLLEGKPPRAHPALDAAAFLHEDPSALVVLQAMVEARRWDVWREPFESEAALWHHLNATGAALIWLGAQTLGEVEEAVIRSFGQAAALAQWFRAVPEMIDKGLTPLAEAEDEAVIRLAQEGLRRLSVARAGRPALSGRGLPAMLPGFETEAILRQVVSDPSRVFKGTLGQSEFRKRGRLAWVALSGRW